MKYKNPTNARDISAHRRRSIDRHGRRQAPVSNIPMDGGKKISI